MNTNMRWVTWDQAAISAVISFAVAIVAIQFATSRVRVFVQSISTEIGLISFLYMLWRLAMRLPLDQPSGAIERARQLNRLQEFLHIPSELSLQQFVLRYDWLARSTNFYYAVFHVPAMIAFLVWMFLLHRKTYPHWRSALAMLTATCLVIRYLRVAPPRFLPDLGYVDLATRFGLSVYGPVGTGVSDQFAAMPSIHVGWAAIVSFGIIAASDHKWRWAFALHFVFTTLAVSATGNHWWLDSVVAVAILACVLRLDTFARRKYNETQ